MLIIRKVRKITALVVEQSHNLSLADVDYFYISTSKTIII